MASFRIALIGAGEIGSSSHLPAILSSREMELACLIDPVEVRAKALCREYGLGVPTFPQICLALRAIARAEMPPIDGAIIASPNHTHEAIAIECLENRISVLVEKPLACSLAEGERIICAAERNQTVIAVGYCTRFRRNVQLVGEALRTAYFGQVRGFAYHFGTRGGWSPVAG
jgi:predicted dehydrogenase